MIIPHGIFDFKPNISIKAATWPTDNLVSRWSFNNTLNDSISGNNLSQVGTMAYSNTIKKVGEYSGLFNNTNGAYTDAVVSYLVGGNPFTICFWFNASTGGSWYDPMFYFSKTTDNTWDRIYWSNNADGPPLTVGSASIQYGGSGGYYTPDASSTINYNQWYWFCMTYNKPTMIAYINNAQVGTASQTNNLRNVSQRLGFGYRPENSGYKAKGYISAAYLYSKELSSSERGQLYNGGNGV